MMTTLCFNSVPMELVADSTGDSKLTPKAGIKQKHFIFKYFYVIIRNELQFS